jgi:hypothetical protein
MASKDLFADFDFGAPARTATAAPAATANSQVDLFGDLNLTSPVAPAPSSNPAFASVATAATAAAAPTAPVTQPATPVASQAKALLSAFSKLIPSVSTSSSASSTSTSAAPVAPLLALPVESSMPTHAPVAMAPGGLPEAPLDAPWLIRNHADFEIRVVNPQKTAGLLNVDWSFEVTTKTRLPIGGRTAFSVRRAFADFEWLQAHLESELPHILIPPVLKAKLFATQTDEEWANAQQRFLVKFLMDLVHFCGSATQTLAFNAFLSCNEAQAFADAKKEASTAVAAANSARLTLKERAKQVLTSLPGAVIGLAAAPPPPPALSADEAALMQVVNDALADAKSLGTVLSALRDAMRDHHRALVVISARSAQSAQLALAIASSSKSEAVQSRLARHAGALSSAFAADSASSGTHARRMALSFLEPIEFWCAKAQLLEALCQRLLEARKVCATLKQAQIKAITTANSFNAASHQASLQSLIQRVGDAEQWVERHESTIRNEIALFEQQRVVELRRLMFIFGAHQATAHKELFGVWSDGVAKLN